MFPRACHLVVIHLITILASALPHSGYESYGEVTPFSLPTVWYHAESHPARGLFKRDAPTPGSPQWTLQYPSPYGAPGPIPEALTPQSWLDALHTAEQTGKIPKITVPRATGGNPQYAAGEDPKSPEICSSTWQCRGADDIWDGPSSHAAIGFDDGPSDGSAELYDFLQQQNQTATHFMIGANILQNYPLFYRAYNTLQHDIAVHTWTHPYMTTLSNSQVIAELGWTLQIIHDATGGRVPRYWRPPYGDSDNRVRAIAKEVFGLVQINWNQDSADWSISTGRTTLGRVESSLKSFYTRPKTPGLIILEHELNKDTVGAFIDTYPVIKVNGWIPVSTIQLFGGGYSGAQEEVGEAQSVNVVSSTSTSLPSAPLASAATASSDSAAASQLPSKTASNNNNNQGDVNQTSDAQAAQHRMPLRILFCVWVLVSMLRRWYLLDHF